MPSCDFNQLNKDNETSVDTTLLSADSSNPYKQLAKDISGTISFNAGQSAVDIQGTQTFRKLRWTTQIEYDTAFEETEEGHPLFNRFEHTRRVQRDAAHLAGVLGLDVDLATVIAFGHDCGHVAGGHAGERALDAELKEISNDTVGFSHPQQSVINLESEGIKLTNEMKIAIQRHGDDEFVDKSLKDKGKFTEVLTHNSTREPKTCLEGLLVQIADNSSSTFHDITDMIQNGILTKEKALSVQHEDFRDGLAEFGVTVDELFADPRGTEHKMREQALDTVIKRARETEKLYGEMSISFGDMTQAVYGLRAANYNIIKSAPEIAEQDKSIKDKVHTVVEHYKERQAEMGEKLRGMLTKSPKNATMLAVGDEATRVRINDLIEQQFGEKMALFYSMHSDPQINKMVRDINNQRVSTRDSIQTIQQDRQVSTQQQKLDKTAQVGKTSMAEKIKGAASKMSNWIRR